MNKVIVFDFNWTLFDPVTSGLAKGAVNVLTAARQKGYSLVLLSVSKPERADQIARLGLEPYFNEISLVESKHADLFSDIATRYEADLAQSYVIGDRAHREILHGSTAGWRTIWLQSGKFADELPEDYSPDYTVASLQEIVPII